MKTILPNAGLGNKLQWYLMASYAYYIKHESILEDYVYDNIALDLLTEWDNFEHQHKYLITKEDLECGTLYRLKEDNYPTITKCCAEDIIKQQRRVLTREKP